MYSAFTTISTSNCTWALFSPLIHDNQYKLFLPYRRASQSWCARSAWVSTNALNPRYTRASRWTWWT